MLAAIGQARHVLAEVTRLRSHLDTLPATPGPDEIATPWAVREGLLDTGRQVAIQLGRWEDALDLSAAIATSHRDRAAPATEIARSRFNDYGPALRLGRADQALALLQDCLQAFRDARDTAMIGKTLTALADTEDQRGHGDAAIRLERDALRYKYLAGDIPGISTSYRNHGNYLRRHARQPAQALASHLAAALIEVIIASDDDGLSIEAAAADLGELGSAAVLPGNVTELGRQLGDIPGTDLPGLIARLSPGLPDAEATLHDLIAQARAMGPMRRWWQGKRRRFHPK